jgi:hypothetical protein
LLLCNTALADLAPKYTQALDAFLVRLETYQNNSNYVQILDAFVVQLNTLKPKYSSNTNVPLMIDYLLLGISDLKSRRLASDIEDDFINELNKSLTNYTNSSTSSS